MVPLRQQIVALGAVQKMRARQCSGMFVTNGREAVSYTFIARFKVHPDKESAFNDAASKLEAAVADKEPGAIYYKFYKLREPNAYAVFESFVDEAADAAHQQSDHFKAIAPALIECIDGGWEREYLDPLGSL